MSNLQDSMSATKENKTKPSTTSFWGHSWSHLHPQASSTYRPSQSLPPHSAVSSWHRLPQATLFHSVTVFNLCISVLLLSFLRVPFSSHACPSPFSHFLSEDSLVYSKTTHLDLHSLLVRKLLLSSFFGLQQDLLSSHSLRSSMQVSPAHLKKPFLTSLFATSVLELC